jgi:hypothetical protein
MATRQLQSTAATCSSRFALKSVFLDAVCENENKATICSFLLFFHPNNLVHEVTKQEGLIHEEYNDVVSNIDVMKYRNKAIDFLQVKFSKLTILPAPVVTVT